MNFGKGWNDWYTKGEARYTALALVTVGNELSEIRRI
jgi:hypothetical protein